MMSATFESDVLTQLTELSVEVASLGRAVRGAPDEGNVGIHTKIDSLEERGDERHQRVDSRLDGLDRSFLRMRVWVGSAAALGGALGATIAVILDLRRLVGGP